MTLIRDYALLSEVVYNNEPTAEGYTLTAFKNGGRNSLQAAVFTKHSKTIVAFKGTSTTADIFSDIALGVGFNTDLFAEGERFLALQAPSRSVVLTGHSLGGAIAQAVGNRHGLPFITFNAPGVAIVASQNIASASPLMGAVRLVGGLLSALNDPIEAARDASTAFDESRGINYRLSGDVVSQTGLHYGPIVTQQASGDFVHQHKMSTMKDILARGTHGRIMFPR